MDDENLKKAKAEFMKSLVREEMRAKEFICRQNEEGEKVSRLLGWVGLGWVGLGRVGRSMCCGCGVFRR